jgi:small-conductance mechanosensitive channel
MKRDDILERSKNAKNDEGIKHAENRGRKLGIAIFGFVAVAIIAIVGFALPLQISRPVTDTVLILTATLGITENLAIYRFSRQKKYAIYVALLAIMFIISVFRFTSVIAGVA